VHDFSSFSGGEQQRISLANLVAFSELLNQFGFMFLDEVLELSLDTVGKTNVIGLLHELSSTYGSIFVVTHDPTLLDSFDTAITNRETQWYFCGEVR